MTPFFSVVIPLYNKATFIKKTLQSIFEQSFDDFEIIVVDDGSSDGSAKLVQSLKHPKIQLFTQENKGAAAARNVGIEHSKGTYIALLDADDHWHPNHLQALHDSIQLFPTAKWFGNQYCITYANGRNRVAHFALKVGETPFLVNDYFAASIHDSLAWTSSVAFTKSFFEAVGKFDEQLLTGQDIDLWIRMALASSFVFNPQTTMVYRRDVSELAQTEHNQQRYHMLQKYLKEETSNESLQKYLTINRYALAIRCKLNNEISLATKVVQTIQRKHLNWKQRLLLDSPTWGLRLIKRLQLLLFRFGFYVTAYK